MAEALINTEILRITVSDGHWLHCSLKFILFSCHLGKFSFFKASQRDISHVDMPGFPLHEELLIYFFLGPRFVWLLVLCLLGLIMMQRCEQIS